MAVPAARPACPCRRPRARRRWRPGAALLAVPLLAGCLEWSAVGPSAVVMGTSLVLTGRTPVDHVASLVTGRDCSAVHIERREPWCRPTTVEPPPQAFCTRSLGAVDCWAAPPTGSLRQAADPPAPLPDPPPPPGAGWSDLLRGGPAAGLWTTIPPAPVQVVPAPAPVAPAAAASGAPAPAAAASAATAPGVAPPAAAAAGALTPAGAAAQALGIPASGIAPSILPAAGIPVPAVPALAPAAAPMP